MAGFRLGATPATSPAWWFCGGLRLRGHLLHAATVVAASSDIGAVAEPCDVYAALSGTGTFIPVAPRSAPR